MSIVLLFLLILVVSFAVLLYFLKPTAIERAVEQQLADIEKSPTSSTSPGTILKDEAVRETTVLDQLFDLMPWAPALTQLVKRSGREWHPSSVFFLSVGIALAAAWLGSLFIPSLLLSIGLGLIAGIIPIGALVLISDQRRRRFEDLLPEAVDLMARGLRAGHSITAVLEMVGTEIADPVGKEFRALHKEQTLGLPIREAMGRLIDNMPIDDMRFLVTAILLQKESGGNLAQILDKTSAVMRERARLRGQLRIYTAQGRITGWILGAAPFLMFALISVVNHNYEKPLFTTPLGLKLVYGALGMMLLGILAIRKIIDVKV
ncbi:MAG TPA: type II secretion system F family protein [Terriglobales bacterium]|jgi:tight adherence protein B|nr:type II secretion system F family protein [Terriglobales bacterium]